MTDLSDFKRRVYEPEVAALKQQAANRSAIIVRLERVIDTLQAQSAAATSQIAAASDSRARLHDRFEAAEERIATLERERDEALAALDRLVAERDAAERLRREDHAEWHRLEARAEAAEAERDRLREQAHRMAAEVDDLAKQRIERNAEIKRLRDALQRIASDGSPDDAAFARAALGDDQ